MYEHIILFSLLLILISVPIIYAMIKYSKSMSDIKDMTDKFDKNLDYVNKQHKIIVDKYGKIDSILGYIDSQRDSTVNNINSRVEEYNKRGNLNSKLPAYVDETFAKLYNKTDKLETDVNSSNNIIKEVKEFNDNMSNNTLSVDKLKVDNLLFKTVDNNFVIENTDNGNQKKTLSFKNFSNVKFDDGACLYMDGNSVCSDNNGGLNININEPLTIKNNNDVQLLKIDNNSIEINNLNVNGTS